MEKEQKLLSVARLYLVHLIFAFVGWVWETVHVSILASEFVDRGFLFGPICPIYGLTIIIAHLLIGMPKNPRGILRSTQGKWYKYPLYFIAAMALPTLVEIVVGPGCQMLFGIRLWDYSHYVITIFGKEIPLHFMGYIALPISLLWSLLIFVSMGLVLPLLIKLIEKIPSKATKMIAIILGSITAVDIIASSIVALI